MALVLSVFSFDRFPAMIIFFSASFFVSMILGFLKTSPRDNPQGNYGMLDVVAALHWLRSNAPAFGGDPGRLTLIGIGYGAALVNLLMLSPVAKGMGVEN